MDEQGFIKLSRRFFKHPIWNEPRQLSRAEAWLDLIYSARFEASKKILNNRVIEVRRGEIIASRRFLEQRWNWGSSKVTNFLKFLKNEGMINQRQSGGQTILTLCNYDSYNDSQTSELQENEPRTNQVRTSNKPVTNQNKESKEEKESKEDIIPPVSPGEKIIDEKTNFSFDEFWDLYDKKVGKKDKLIKKWLKLSDKERELAMSYIPEYKIAQPDKQFRKNPETFLNQKSWNDELIYKNGNKTSETVNSSTDNPKVGFSQKDYSGGF